MKVPLRVLVFEDSEDDALINIELLKKANFDPTFERVQSEKEARRLLTEKTWDLVLSDYQMPGFLGTDGLKIVRQMGLDIPFIIISGTLGEEQAVEAMKNGASDYFTKKNTKRLAAAVERELHEATIRRKQRESQIALRQSEEQNRKLIELSPDGIIILIDNKIVFANQVACKLLGGSSKDLLDKSLQDFVPELFQKQIKSFYSQISQNQGLVQPIQLIFNNLEKVTIQAEIIGTQLIYQNKEAIYLILRDIHDRWQAQIQLEAQQKINELISNSTSLISATEDVLKYLCEKFAFDVGQIWSFNPSENLLRCVATTHPASGLNVLLDKGKDNLSSEYEVEKVLETKKPFWIEEISEKTHFSRIKEAQFLNLKSGVVFPIIYGKEIYGAVELYSHESRMIDPAILKISEIIGNQIGTLIKQKYTEDFLLYYSDHDAISGCLNINAFRILLEKSLKKELPAKRKIAVIVINIDNLKMVEDAFGISTEEELIKNIAIEIQAILATEESIFARDRDNFYIALINPAPIESLQTFLNEVRGIFVKLFTIQDNKMNIFANIGVALAPEDDTEAHELIKKALVAVSKSKDTGNNTIQFFTHNITENTKNKMVLAAQLREAIPKLQFTLFYQPKVALPDNTVLGFEALVRWERPQGMLQPNEFIPILEETGLIIQLSEWVFSTACIQTKKLHTLGFDELTISVNLSMRHFKDSKLIDCISSALKSSELDPKYFELEITESFIMTDPQKSINILNKLSDLGLKLSIDDFGTGYSSFAYLKDLPVDRIKIDQTFIRNCLNFEKDAAIVSSMITLGHNLNLKVIAEGVSSKEIHDFLIEHHCDEIQGFYISPPISQDEMIRWLEQNRESQKIQTMNG